MHHALNKMCGRLIPSYKAPFINKIIHTHAAPCSVHAHASYIYLNEEIKLKKIGYLLKKRKTLPWGYF